MKLQYVVAEVVGKTTEAGFVDEIRSACAGKGRIVQVDELRLASIPRDDRHNALSENGLQYYHLRRLCHLLTDRFVDAFFAKSLEKAMETDSLTILFLSTPSEPTYEPDFVGSLHTDLKRSSRNIPVRRKNDDADWNKLPLFEKYQFFTPGIYHHLSAIPKLMLTGSLGIFMAIITVIVLFMILGVGLRALSSLEVSYGAFEKEMGPAAQKKQQWTFVEAVCKVQVKKEMYCTPTSWDMELEGL